MRVSFTHIHSKWLIRGHAYSNWLHGGFVCRTHVFKIIEWGFQGVNEGPKSVTYFHISIRVNEGLKSVTHSHSSPPWIKVSFSHIYFAYMHEVHWYVRLRSPIHTYDLCCPHPNYLPTYLQLLIFSSRTPLVLRTYMTISTEIATPQKSTESRKSNSSVSRGTDSNWDYDWI